MSLKYIFLLKLNYLFKNIFNNSKDTKIKLDVNSILWSELSKNQNNVI